MATYLHALDGRIRVRLPEIRGDRRTAARLRQTLRTRSGVTAAEVNPLTGSVLVEYDGDCLSADDIFDVLDVEPPTGTVSEEGLLRNESSSRRTDVRDAVAETLIQVVAERLLLAVLA
jgi:copper chaperone CopZ